ncbi:uncharacterized protein LOC131688427 [Topomyia yanbarensis]|uniref:uncharacterized protein LOC131688427 n=1 Tax=Topomyia yanbarensis TaxID=2498891 RepID=UPI00273AF4A9|nr:uncharacterized protein LOC131688427 [Topomyia yanbarensis]
MMEDHRFVLAPEDLTENYDNGADGTGTTSTPNRSKPKSKNRISKKMLMQELIALKTELNAVRSEKDRLLLDREVNSTSSEQVRMDTTLDVCRVSENESLLATMNHMSLGSLHIPECKPSEGETDLDKKAYEHWKEIVTASFNLVRATDEHAKMDIFKIKAGTKLLEVMQGTSTTNDMPEECTHPFSNAIARLDRYFGSRTYIIGQRGKLMNTIQLKGESSVSYVRRVANAAKLCDYGKEEEMEATVRTIVKGTSDSRVRVLAQRNWVNQGDMNSLIAMVRDREMEIFNEDEYQKLNRQSTATVAALSQDQRVQIRRGSGTRFRGTQRGRGPFQRGLSRSQGSSQSACWRCASIYHGPANCPNLDKVCHNCNRRGHLARTCSALSRQGIAQKRSHGSDDEEPKPKLAAITQNGDDIDEKVHDIVQPE